jgi:hypothetical protein
MPRISVTVVNGELVRQGLQNLQAAIPQIGRKVIYDKMNVIAVSMRKYPPQRARSRYIRTYRLRDSVTVLRLNNGYAIEIDPVQRGRHYGKYVIGNARGDEQAWMHVGRWHLFANVVEHHLRRLPDDIERFLRQSGGRLTQ